METKLARIAQLSNENPNMVFTSVGHLIDRELLAKCHEGWMRTRLWGSMVSPKMLTA